MRFEAFAVIAAGSSLAYTSYGAKLHNFPTFEAEEFDLAQTLVTEQESASPHWLV